jgi:hypothetical protein
VSFNHFLVEVWAKVDDWSIRRGGCSLGWSLDDVYIKWLLKNYSAILKR